MHSTAVLYKSEQDVVEGSMREENGFMQYVKRLTAVYLVS